MNRSVSVVRPVKRFQADQSDHAFWMHIAREVGADIPDHLITFRPWRWLNNHHHPLPVSHKARVLPFPSRPLATPHPKV